MKLPEKSVEEMKKEIREKVRAKVEAVQNTNMHVSWSEIEDIVFEQIQTERRKREEAAEEAHKNGVRDMRDYCQKVVSKISGDLVAVFNEKAKAFIEDITQPNENAPLTVVSSEDLGDELGEQVVCPNCNQLHCVEYGTDGKSGEIIQALAFVSCKENNKAYLVGINNKEIKHGA